MYSKYRCDCHTKDPVQGDGNSLCHNKACYATWQSYVSYQCPHYGRWKPQIVTSRPLLQRIGIMTLLSHCLQSFRGADKFLARPTSRCIFLNGENISFDASLVIYINSTSIPPIMIINRYMKIKIFCHCSLNPSWSG
jgi:hypothetical protein